MFWAGEVNRPGKEMRPVLEFSVSRVKLLFVHIIVTNTAEKKKSPRVVKNLSLR